MCRLYHAALEGKPLAHYEHISTLCIKGEPLAHNDVIGSVLQPFLVYVQADTKKRKHSTGVVLVYQFDLWAYLCTDLIVSGDMDVAF